MGPDDYEFPALDDVDDEDFLDDAWDDFDPGDIPGIEGIVEDINLRVAPRLPRAPKTPDHRHLESFDRENSICIHELARAMEEYATKEPVKLYGGSVEFEEAARSVLELAHKYRCDLKGR